MALGHLGIDKRISALTDDSAAANACNFWMDKVRDEIFDSYPWPFLTTFLSLALVEADPTTEWAYSYTYPSDCRTIRRILSQQRQDSLQSRTEFRVVGELIYTDQVDAIAEYTQSNDVVDNWPMTFQIAFSALLAFYIAPGLISGDPFKLGQRAYQLYLEKSEAAKGNASNEEGAGQPVEAESITGRN